MAERVFSRKLFRKSCHPKTQTNKRKYYQSGNNRSKCVKIIGYGNKMSTEFFKSCIKDIDIVHLDELGKEGILTLIKAQNNKFGTKYRPIERRCQTEKSLKEV